MKLDNKPRNTRINSTKTNDTDINNTKEDAVGINGTKTYKIKEKKNRINNKKFFIITAIIIVIIVVLISVLASYFESAKKSLKTTDSVVDGKNINHKSISDSVEYNGGQYIYNADIVNILVLGIDSDLPVTQKQEKIGDMGQTDAIYLVSIDTKKHSLQVYAIPRDSMCEVDIYDESGKLVSLMDAQLALQYNFALDCVNSSRLSAEAVSRLMYNIPIDRVCVFNCEAIGVINDAVGGVEVTIENDFTDESGEVLEPEFYKGNTLKLNGEQAVTFIRERDCSIFKSAMDRVERQEQYISSLVSTAKSKLKRNTMIALSILNKLKENDCIYTDISASELMYIAQLAGRTHFSMEDVTTIPGEVKMGEEFEEYHTDSTALKKIVLENFYTKVK